MDETARTRIPLCEPCLAGREVEYVRQCVESGWVSSVGSFVDEFERAIAREAGCEFAVATVNGTSALHVSLVALGIGLGDEVLMPSMTFIAPANAVAYVGASPVFVDAGGADWQMDLPQVAEFLRQDCQRTEAGLRNRHTGRRVAAMLPVHILGCGGDMDFLVALAEEFQLPVIEDATESLGARWQGKPLGSFGKVGCFSFNGNKLLTTGGGGMVVTQDEALAKRIRHLTTQAKASAEEYEHDEVGYNYRLTNLQAALGLAQVEQLAVFLQRKREIAQLYRREFANLEGLSWQEPAADMTSAEWLFTIRLREKSGKTARGLRSHLASQGIQSRCLWEPMHLSRPHRHCACLGGEVAEALYSEALSLPCSSGLTESQQRRVIAAVRDFLAN